MQKITEDALNNALLEDNLLPEGETLLSDAMDEALAAPEEEIDYAALDECADALIELQGGSYNEEETVLLLPTAQEMLQKAKGQRRPRLSRAVKLLLVAAILLVSTLTANAAVGSITGETLVQKIAVSIDDGARKPHKHKEEETTAQTAASKAYRYTTKRYAAPSTTAPRRQEKDTASLGEPTSKEETTTEETTEETTLEQIQPAPPEEDPFETTDEETVSEEITAVLPAEENP